MVELQDLLEKQNYELAQMKERMSSLSSRVSEVEQELETARKDLIKSEEMNNKYQRDIKEVTAHVRLTTRAHAMRAPEPHQSKLGGPIKGLYYHTLFQPHTHQRKLVPKMEKAMSKNAKCDGGLIAINPD